MALLNTIVSSAIQGSYTPYILGSQTPPPDDSDKVWVQTDTSGRPISIKTYYNGSWRAVYTGIPGEVRFYIGNPTQDFDSTGLGMIGGNWDGWALMNGANGTVDLSNRFIVSANMTNQGGFTGYQSDGWHTFISGGDPVEGGSDSVTIEPNQLPPFDAVAGSSKVTIHGFEAKETSSSHTTTSVLVDVHYSDLLPHDAVIGNYGSGPNDTPPVPQAPVATVPPFYTFALAQFVGYS